jgi:hypothetical protein
MDLKIAPVYNAAGKYLYYDLVIEDKDYVLISGPEEIGQRVVLRLSLHLGEWFEAQDEGINQQEAFSESEDSIILRDTIKAVILKTRAVNSIKTFELESLNPDTRELKINTELDSDEGTIKIEEPIYG